MKYLRSCATNAWKGFVTTLIGVGLIGSSIYLIITTQEAPFNIIILTILGIICVGIPDPQWNKLKELLNFWRRNGTKAN